MSGARVSSLVPRGPASDRHHRPDRLDHPEGPGPLQEAVHRCQRAGAGERQDEPAAPRLQRVAHHHRGHRDDAEHGQAVHEVRAVRFARCDAHGVPANRAFLMTAWTPQLPSTTWVTPKSTAIDMSEMASSSLSPRVVMRKWRILRKASRSARSTDDFE